MSSKQFLTGSELPFCKGCGHATIAQNTEKALQKMGLNPLDVVLVTDIGCHGIIDKNFLTHTVHGLHGRSVALASGITAGLNNPDKKVIVYIGDGGATIGMQHLIGAAHMGFDMTVVIHNNMLYGMTGGQPSEFTPSGFKTPTLSEGSSKAGYDICDIMVSSGATHVARIMGIGDYSNALAEAFSAKGFSVVEVMEICTSYGVKSNPGMKLAKVVEESGLPLKTYSQGIDKVFRTANNPAPQTLLTRSLEVESKYSNHLNRSESIMLAGSAGEGVQSAAEFYAKAAMLAGLNVTKKGSYPVTVGVGFSTSEIIISPNRIYYTGSPIPDVLIITSDDGLSYAKATAAKMKQGILLVDETLEAPSTGAKVIRVPFRERAGARNSALYSMFWYLNHSQHFPVDALKEVFLSNKISEKVKVETMLLFS